MAEMEDNIKIKPGSYAGRVDTRKYGRGSRSCRACFTHRGIIRQFDLYLCRRCFREYALEIGFRKVD